MDEKSRFQVRIFHVTKSHYVDSCFQSSASCSSTEILVSILKTLNVGEIADIYHLNAFRPFLSLKKTDDGFIPIEMRSTQIVINEIQNLLKENPDAS